MPSQDTLTRPLSRPSPSTFTPEEPAGQPATDLPLAPVIDTESSRPQSHGEQSLNRLLIIDAAASAVCAVAAIPILTDYSPITSAWLGFLSVNAALWIGVALAGVFLIVRDNLLRLVATPRRDVPRETATSPCLEAEDVTLN